MPLRVRWHEFGQRHQNSRLRWRSGRRSAVGFRGREAVVYGVLSRFPECSRCSIAQQPVLIFDGSFAGFLEPQPDLFLDASRQKLIGFQTATYEAAYAFTDFPVGFPEELEAGW